MGTWSTSRTQASRSSLISQDWDRQLLTTSTLGPYVGRRRGPVTVLAAGTGGPAAAAGTATALAVASAAHEPFGLVVSMGTAGGFRGSAEIGDLLVADRIVAADLGAESGVGDDTDAAPGRRGRLDELDVSLGFTGSRVPGGAGGAGGGRPREFLTMDDLGLGSNSIVPDGTLVRRLETSLSATGRRVVKGTVITVATVTGTERRAWTLTRRLDPAGEAMEGYAVGVAAAAFGVPVAEIRAVSNLVGRRDRSTWDVQAALGSLRAAAGALVSHPEGLLADGGPSMRSGAGQGN
jgi:futalosine hydrolase